MGRPLHFQYETSRKFCEALGLIWLGDEWIRNADEEAWVEGMSQSQVDLVLRHALVHIKYIFTPKTYSYWQRVLLAFYFLTGWFPRRN